MIIDKIIADKRAELLDTKAALPLEEVKAMAADATQTVDFASVLIDPERLTIIAEVKKASPSKGIIRADFDPVGIAAVYEQSGARAVSVLTERKYFQGDLRFLRDISEGVNIPVLRKDFIFDPYQVYESRANGADAVLLIASVLSPGEIRDLYHLAKELGMDAVLEVHDEADVAKAAASNCLVIGINNRDLKTFEVDIKNTAYLIEDIPEGRVVISESGISTLEDLKYLRGAGADAALIGEAIMREKDYGRKLRELANG